MARQSPLNQALDAPLFKAPRSGLVQRETKARRTALCDKLQSTTELDARFGVALSFLLC